MTSRCVRALRVVVLVLAGLAGPVSTRSASAQTEGPSVPGAAQPRGVQLPPVTVEAPRRRSTRPKPASVARPASARAVPAEAGRAAPAQTAASAPPAAPPAAASELTVSGAEINAIPHYRVGEVLEAVPGLVVSQHSSEGKANQYFLRGFALDHGTDFAVNVDGMPINMRTHAHGQGYADINFLIPELIKSMQVRKGPYFADEGDFSSAGAARINYIDRLDPGLAQITAGSFGYWRMLAAKSYHAAAGDLLVAGEVHTNNGPWDVPDNLRKLNGVLRYSQGTPENGFSVTGMGYVNRWTATDQIPTRAVSLRPDRSVLVARSERWRQHQPVQLVGAHGRYRRDRGHASRRLCHSQHARAVQQLHLLPERSA